MAEPAEVLGQARLLLSRRGSLDGRKVIVTAGGTQEPIDPVRVIANRSSGKQGLALAQASLDLGAEVTLIIGPICLAIPPGAQRVEVNTTGEMLEAVLAASAAADVLLMAAAPADFRPANPVAHKLKKEAGAPPIQLAANPDILAAVARQKDVTGCPKVTVGFAAESQDLLENARHKLEVKKLDLIAANDISPAATGSGFAGDTNRVTLLFPDGRVEALPLMTKGEVAELILGKVLALLKEQLG
jgi:phosphopantothenoylcysteine decarboxylase/phosphopantothenate--cysteine ligase